MLEKIKNEINNNKFTFKHLKRKYNEEADKLSKNAAKNENNLYEE